MPTETVLAPVDFDLTTADLVTGRLAAAFDSGADLVVLDLSNVGFVDSSGFRAVVNGRKRARQTGCRLEVRGAPPAVRRLAEMTGLRLDDVAG